MPPLLHLWSAGPSGELLCPPGIYVGAGDLTLEPNAVWQVLYLESYPQPCDCCVISPFVVYICVSYPSL